METKKVAIVGYSRIPFARINTAYADLDNQELLEASLNGLINKYRLQGKLLGEVAGGAVIKHISESNLIRETVMNTALDPATPACDLQQACDTGIEAAVYIGNKIALGQIESGIACGVEAMSNIPFESAPRLRKALLNSEPPE
jgi:acetyl-CoA C-acetyltransferase